MTETFAAYSARLGDFIRRTSHLGEGARSALAEEKFEAMALSLFALQFEYTPAYRQLCATRQRHPGNVRHWTQIPPAPTVAFKELELSSLLTEERTAVFHSSGTTEHRPSRHYHDGDSLAVYETSLRPWFQQHLLPETLQTKEGNVRAFQFVSLTPGPSAAPHSSLIYMLASLHREFGSADSFFGGTTTSEGDWVLDAERLITGVREAVRPVLLLGTAFNFVGLLDHLANRSQRLRLPEGSRALETGGYKGRSRALPKQELHALMTDRLGIPTDSIVSEYGMSELSSQAYDTIAGSVCAVNQDARLFHFPPWARAQIISPETGHEVAEGETGLIRVADLANVRSVLAVQTEDLGIRRRNGFQLLGRAARAEARGCSLMAT